MTQHHCTGVVSIIILKEHCCIDVVSKAFRCVHSTRVIVSKHNYIDVIIYIVSGIFNFRLPATQKSLWPNSSEAVSGTFRGIHQGYCHPTSLYRRSDHRANPSCRNHQVHLDPTSLYWRRRQKYTPCENRTCITKNKKCLKSSTRNWAFESQSLWFFQVICEDWLSHQEVGIGFVWSFPRSPSTPHPPNRPSVLWATSAQREWHWLECVVYDRSPITCISLVQSRVGTYF